MIGWQRLRAVAQTPVCELTDMPGNLEGYETDKVHGALQGLGRVSISRIM